jgi:hypothetical protein
MLNAQAGFNPQVGLTGISSGVPKSYDEYVKKAQAQWEFGRERAIEAMEQPPGSKRHIRKP